MILNFLIVTLTYIPALFLLYYIYSLMILYLQIRNKNRFIHLYGGGLFSKGNFVFHTILAGYIVLTLLAGILHFSKVITLYTNDYLFFACLQITILIFLGSSIVHVHVNHQGVLMGRKFYNWGCINTIDKLEVMRYESYYAIRIQVKDTKPMTGLLHKSHIEQLDVFIQKKW